MLCEDEGASWGATSSLSEFIASNAVGEFGSILAMYSLLQIRLQIDAVARNVVEHCPILACSVRGKKR